MSLYSWLRSAAKLHLAFRRAFGPAMFLASDLANYVHGQVINVTGGQFSGMYT